MTIPFTCPHCGAKTEVAEMYAGQTGPCAQCGKTVTVPYPGGAAPARQGMSGGTIALIVLAVCLVLAVLCGGLLVAMLLPAVNAAREAARNAACTNNLRQIDLALHAYESAHGEFPPAYTTDKDGKPLQSWRVLILPYMEQQYLYDQIRKDEPWDSPHNQSIFSSYPIPPVYRCPSEPLTPGNTDTSYFLITGPGTVFEGGKAPKPGDFTRGMAHTAVLVEASGQGVPWMKPEDIDAGNLGSITSAHPQGINVGMADGSVQRIDKSAASQVIRQMATGK